MSTELDDERLRQALRDAGAGLVPRPDVVERARHGGQRRLRRRRRYTALVAGVAALAALGTAGAVAYRPDPPRPTPTVAPDVPLVAQPTRGDLAKDAAARQKAVTAFRQPGSTASTPGETTGAPHVVWIGHTPDGEAAVVAQSVTPPHPRPGQEGESIRVALLVADAHGSFGHPDESVFPAWTDPEQRTRSVYSFQIGSNLLVILDTGRPTYYSIRRAYTSTGITRQWTRADFVNGSAVVPLPSGAAVQVAMSRSGRYGTKPPGAPGTVDNLPPIPDTTLGWAPTRTPQPTLNLFVGTGATAPGWARGGGAGALFTRGLSRSDFYDPAAVNRKWSSTPWTVYGETASGDRFVVGEVQYDADPSHIYAVVSSHGKYDVVYGGESDRAATLPVHVKLPGDAGWVIAKKGAALAYRTGSGAWRQAGRDAALIPSTATEARVNTTPAPLG